uniref:NADH-ubiquinone oxidoreductase chain 5 n=1 Tax=Homonota fasciata TaxID=401549 RepID=A0A1Y1CC72_9SAUR|nr:NADH dehydrogenase subunit 5 [Homonota fasciata]
MTETFMCTALTMTLLTLLAPLMTAHPSQQIITSTIKVAFTLSLLPTLTLINTGLYMTTTNFTWTPTNLNISTSFLFDTYSTTFLPTALFITWAIMQFTNWYMTTDPHLNKFSKYLLMFLIAMMILITANNMLQLFIGWEGVGIMSFLLIGWWHARTAATASALQAVIYNRIGDIGLILAMAWMATNLNTWDIQQLFAQNTMPLLPLTGIILAATGKSAQFGLHPWLPAAMEGPTPVSALLHSSTMVVAGVFLLIRLHPLLKTNPQAMTTCLCLGAMTTIFAAMCAVTQNDIKKVIAFSTSSQLGLMVLTVGMNMPELAFLHITTHAFFKALLFLCSGSIIHSLNNEQDLRKMGSMYRTLPTTAACMTLGSLALIGTPFLAGFYTKDTIIETMNTSNLNAWALLTTMVATTMTAAYSLRLVYYTQLGPPRHEPTVLPTETSQDQINPLMRLALGSIIAGLVMTSLQTPNTTTITTLPTTMKLAALLATLAGLLLALDLTHKTTHLLFPQQNLPHTTMTKLSFYNALTHRLSPQTTMKFANISLHLNDASWYETTGPKMLININTATTKTLAKHHHGALKTCLLTFTALLGSCLALHLYGTR